jgi:phosphoribosyl 1,2-cyclic phosphodiesterase
MLVNGNYPHFLKARIRSDHGHLGNHQTSAFLADYFSDHTGIICLAHLSKNNNTPGLVLQTLQQAFSDRGIILNGQQQISVLNRNKPSDVIRLIE